MPVEISSPLDGGVTILRTTIESNIAFSLRDAGGNLVTLTHREGRPRARSLAILSGSASALAIARVLRQAVGRGVGVAVAYGLSRVLRQAVGRGVGVGVAAAESLIHRTAGAQMDGLAAARFVSDLPVTLPDLPYHVLLRVSELTAFADTAGTTPAAIGGAVARITGLSTPAINATQSTVAARPIRRATASISRIEFDGVDDRLIVPATTDWIKNGQSLVVVMRAQTSVTNIVLLGNAGASDTALAGYLSMVTSPTAASTSIGAGTYYKNGAVVGTDINRTTAYSAYVTGGWVIVEIAGLDLIGTAIASQGAQFPGWRSRTAELGPVDIGAWLILPTATLNTGTNRTDLVAALAAQFGITP